MLILILKKITLLGSNHQKQFRLDKNQLNTDVDKGIDSGKINNRDKNVLSNIKKMSFKAGFFIFKARLTIT